MLLFIYRTASPRGLHVFESQTFQILGVLLFTGRLLEVGAAMVIMVASVSSILSTSFQPFVVLIRPNFRLFLSEGFERESSCQKGGEKNGR